MLVDVKLNRNVANHGRGSEMTDKLHEALDEIEILRKIIYLYVDPNQVLSKYQNTVDQIASESEHIVP